MWGGLVEPGEVRDPVEPGVWSIPVELGEVRDLVEPEVQCGLVEPGVWGVQYS